jgi:FMN reductase [NAD(P)H]
MPHDNEPSHHGSEDYAQESHSNSTVRLLLERSSCRSFYEKPIPEDVLRTLLEAATHAPTGGNLQPFSIIRIEEAERKNDMCRLCGDQSFIATAPTNLLFCIDWYRLRRWAELEKAPFTATSSFRHFWISFQDTIIAAQNLCTAADALDLGSVYVGTVTECFPEIRRICDLPDGVFPVVLLSLGYPKERPSPRLKLDIDILTHIETYRRPSDDEIRAAYVRKYPYRGVEATPERIAKMERVCRRVAGEELARECLERIETDDIINVAQRYFGLHYSADSMPEGNDRYLQLMKEFGFGWFEKFVPAGDSD